MTGIALEYLQEKEWSDISGGAGRYPECGGHKPDAGWAVPRVGHYTECELARSIAELDGTVYLVHRNPDYKEVAYQHLADNSWPRRLKAVIPD